MLFERTALSRKPADLARSELEELRDLLERKLQQAIESARRTLAARASSFQEPA